MKKTSIFLLSCLFSGAVIAKAGDQTLSFGYLNVNANGTKKLTEQVDTANPDGVATVYADGYSGAGGVSARYRYEISDDWGFIGSFAYSKTNYSSSLILNVDNTTSKFKHDANGEYMSLMIGPTYRLNDYLSVYGLVGFGYKNANFDLEVTKYGKRSFSRSETDLAYGVGMQLNIYKDITLDAGYEQSGSGDWKTNAWTIGIGYKF